MFSFAVVLLQPSRGCGPRTCARSEGSSHPGTQDRRPRRGASKNQEATGRCQEDRPEQKPAKLGPSWVCADEAGTLRRVSTRRKTDRPPPTPNRHNVAFEQDRSARRCGNGSDAGTTGHGSQAGTWGLSLDQINVLPEIDTFPTGERHKSTGSKGSRGPIHAQTYHNQ